MKNNAMTYPSSSLDTNSALTEWLYPNHLKMVLRLTLKQFEELTGEAVDNLITAYYPIIKNG